MLVVEAAPDGSNREAIHELAKTMDQFFIVDRGKTYGEQSSWEMVAQSWWSRFLHKLGMTRHKLPLIAIAATASCNAEQLPWSDLDNSSLLEKRLHN